MPDLVVVDRGRAYARQYALVRGFVAFEARSIVARVFGPEFGTRDEPVKNIVGVLARAGSDSTVRDVFVTRDRGPVDERDDEPLFTRVVSDNRCTECAVRSGIPDLVHG